MKRAVIIAYHIFLVLAGLHGQTSGQIIDAAIPASNPLDPNGDGWISASGAAFISDDHTESEINYVAIPQYGSEPNGDLLTGASCGATDIVDNASTGEDASYVAFTDPDGIENSGDELLLYRLRIASNTTGNFGFSVFIDTDGLFGSSGLSADPNAVSGNLGFELEINLATKGGSKGLHVYDIDGSTSANSTLRSYDIDSMMQKSYALHQDPSCSGTPVFYDFFVFLSDLGISSSTSVRFVTATSSSGGSALGGSASDIGGIDGSLATSGNNMAKFDYLTDLIIGASSPIPINNLGGVLPVKWLGFRVNDVNGVAHLEWETAFEINNQYFEIEYAQDGSDFKTIGNIQAAGNTTQHTSYHFKYINPNGIEGYYRVKQVDFNGQYTYSAIIAIRTTLSGPAKIHLYPNPGNGHSFFLEGNGSGQENVTVQVTDLSGRVIQLIENLQIGIASKVRLHEKLPKGTYLVIINGDTGSKSVIYIVQ